MKRSFLVLTALTLVFGAQSFRVLLPSLTFYWGATLGLTAGLLVAASFAPIALAWLAPPLGKRLGVGRTLRAFGVQMILEAGFVDAWSESGQPERPRIDWIFHTPDLMARDVVVIESPASDHPAFAATIRPRR